MLNNFRKGIKMKSNRAIINLDTGEIIKELPQASLQTKEEHLVERLDKFVKFL